MSTTTNARARTSRFLVAVYKYAISPFLHSISRTVSGPSAGCRFHPTCSEYAAVAWSVHGPWRGGWLAMLRVLRCHPFARGGFDPVPDVPVSVGPGVSQEKQGHLT